MAELPGYANGTPIRRLIKDNLPREMQGFQTGGS